METKADMTFCVLTHLFLLAATITRYLTTSCSFPDSLQMDTRDPPWYSHIKTDGSRDAEYYIRHNVMEIHYPRSGRPNIRWKCTMPFHDKLLLKRQDHLVNTYFRCALFIFRSRSVLQIMWSREVRTFDLSLCEDSNLEPDPWVLISYETLEQDWTPCPFSGGFDMKVVDSLLGENGCNLMLRPMRMEVDCVGGEGVTFDFISSNCLPAIRMYFKQRTICVTKWQDQRNHYAILRRNEDVDLWCLVMPLQYTSNTTAYLYSDLACVPDPQMLLPVSDIRFFTLYLHTRLFPSLCEDEYEQCNRVSCNTYVRQECYKSCGMCLDNSSPSVRNFPESYIGTWFLKDPSSIIRIVINSSNITVNGVGQFTFVSFQNNTEHSSSIFSTVSLYENGCRPRYTCIKLHKIGRSVLQYSLSHSFVWPYSNNNIGKVICKNDRFFSDPSPIDDKYRPHEGAGKPIISFMPKVEPVTCNLTSVYAINATLPKGYKCSGSLYRHCENSSKLRLDFYSCGDLIPASTDYLCLANFAGHYWERILLVQNSINETDAICFVFNQFYPNEAYVLVASQCDQKSFNFARSGLRQPLLKLVIQPESNSCKSAPNVLTTTAPTETIHGLKNPETLDFWDYNPQTNMTSAGQDIPVSVETGSYQDEHAHQRGIHLGTRVRPEVPSAKSTSFSDEDSLRAAAENEATLRIFNLGRILMLDIISVLSPCVILSPHFFID